MKDEKKTSDSQAGNRQTHPKQRKLSVIICAIILVIFIGARFEIIRYKDTKILLFETTPGAFFKDAQSGIVLGNYRLETEYGPITLKHSCEVLAIEHELTDISDKEFKAKHALHELAFMGNPLPVNTSVHFKRERGQYIWLLSIDQDLIIERHEFYIDNIYVDEAGEKQFIITKWPNDITLADKTELKLSSYGEYHLFLKNDGTWTINTRPLSIRFKNEKINKETFPVKLPNHEDYQNYSSVTFKENWGEFISGEIYDETASSLR